ncbi:MAG: helix-turn-helix domain-containing protein [Acidobacteriota bacterium]
MEKLLTPEKVCEILRIERSTLYSWTRKELIPHIKVNGLLRFKEEEINRWLKMKERGAIIKREVEKFLKEIQERR